MNTSFFQELLGSIAERGRALVDRSATRPAGKGGRRTKAAGNAGEPLPGPGFGPRRGLGRGAGPAGARPLCRLARWRPGSSSSACSPAASTRTSRASGRPGRPTSRTRRRRTCRRCWRRSSRRARSCSGASTSPRAARRRWWRCARICSSTAARKRSCASSTTTSRTCSARGSIAAFWSCGRSTGRARPTCWSGSSATRPCTRSRAGTICAAACSRPTAAASASSTRR